MFNWKSIDTVYLYDGSLEGLFTIIFDCYVSKEIPSTITTESAYLNSLFEDPVFIKTDYTKSSRIFHGITKNISDEALYNASYAFLSCQSGKEMAILQYILNGFIIGPKINTMLSIDYVFEVFRLRKNVFGESHRLKGLVRFMEISHNLFYSSIHPDNHVIEHVGNHFIRRFPTQNFILHDKNRNIAMLYNQRDYCIIDTPASLQITQFSEEEKKFQSLWKTFFQTIAIKERTNPRLQMQYMPKKYWQDLVEMK